MINLATCFSGIGAIEYAFKRLGIATNLIFACDNGNIDISLKNDEILTELKKKSNFKEKNNFIKELYKKNSRKTNFVELSYKENYHIEDERFFYDAHFLDGKDFTGEVDLFVGGSPCQSFSQIGSKGGFNDTRGTLFYEFARLVKEIQPRIFIYENVYNILRHDKGKTFEIVKNTFNELGFFYKWEILDSRDFGIPQGRRRFFCVGFKYENMCKNFKFPQKQKLKFTMQDFLLDNAKEGNFTYDNKGNIIIKKEGQKVEKFLSQKLVDYVLSPGTKNFHHEDAKTDLVIARAILSTQGNTHRASVNNYVTTNAKLRALEPRESLRLMGFCDDFKINVSRAQSYKQSGNSIVVDVLMALIKELQKVCL